MFNGIIYNQGIVTKIIKRQKGLNIFIKSNLRVSKKDMGLSVACDGVCLTLISYKSKIMEFYLSKETIERSKFRYLKKNEEINLELPLKYGQKISGHICQGHVDTVGKIIKRPKGLNIFIKSNLRVSKKDMGLSVACDGVCLTLISYKSKIMEFYLSKETILDQNLNL